MEVWKGRLSQKKSDKSSKEKNKNKTNKKLPYIFFFFLITEPFYNGESREKKIFSLNVHTLIFFFKSED